MPLAESDTTKPQRRPGRWYIEGARKGRTRLLATRVRPELYEACKAEATRRGMTLTDFVIGALAPQVGLPSQPELPVEERVA